MVTRALWGLFALVLCLPLVQFAVDEWGPQETVDWNGAEWKARKDLVARAKVVVDSPPDIPSLDLSRMPNDPAPFDPGQTLECRYVNKAVSATTAKFDCRLPNEDVIKVKYGWSPEKSAEVAASRLLAALGFGTDYMTMVSRVRCIGCPWFPFEMRKVAQAFFAAPLVDLVTLDNRAREFAWVSVERKFGGREIEVGPHEGWDWSELATIDASKGGATRAEIDALRLMVVFLSHWDNKATNQRLVCEDGEGGKDATAPCRRPFLVLQDLGATFGPGKVKHEAWAPTPIWTDKARCVVSLETMPYRGGHFTPIQISEEGRKLLAGKLTQFSEAQIRALFEAARFPDPETGDVGDVTAWVRTFQDKVRQIADRAECPALLD
jgi:hypothetical protein